MLQICDLVRDCVGQPDAECSINPAPPDSCAEDSTSTILKRCACKDAKPAASLRKIMSHRKSSNSVQSDLSSWQGSQSEEYGGLEDVQVCHLELRHPGVAFRQRQTAMPQLKTQLPRII